MRKLLFFCFLLFSSFLFANPVTNVRAMQEGKKIVLLYDMAETAYVADVEIRVDGASRLLSLNTLSGDVGREVAAGRDRRIEYDLLLDYDDGLMLDNISFVIILGVQAVDLGLSVKWATCNVGANIPEDYGYYFAWGETQSKENYDWRTYKYCNRTFSINTLTKYNADSRYGRVDNKTTLEAQDDAATANWGGAWRMPTKAEQDELRTKCKWVWTTLNGVYGYKVIGPNGNSIFLPAAGYMVGGTLYDAGSRGYYWSSSLNTGNTNNAYFVPFNSDYVGWGNYCRCYGLAVRLVCP
jgi:hypothetical protein